MKFLTIFTISAAVAQNETAETSELGERSYGSMASNTGSYSGNTGNAGSYGGNSGSYSGNSGSYGSNSGYNSGHKDCFLKFNYYIINIVYPHYIGTNKSDQNHNSDKISDLLKNSPCEKFCKQIS